MTLSELHRKDVIQLKTGENLGRVDDLVFSGETAAVERLILRGRPRWFGLLGRGEDLEIAWEAVKQMGTDVILVDAPSPPIRGDASRRWRW